MKKRPLKQLSLIIRVLSLLLIAASLAPGPRLWAQSPTPKFAYVANQGSNNISAYAIETTSGVLTPVAGSPFAAGTRPSTVGGTFSLLPEGCGPDRCFAYVANQGSNDISAYSINASTGTLTPLPGSPFRAGMTPFFVQLPSSGGFAYVANQGSNDISAYSIDSMGVLTPVGGSPFSAGTTPFFVTIVPSRPGQAFAYLANQGSNDISAYTIDTTVTGVLTPIAGSPFAAGTTPFIVNVSFSPPNQLFAYVANQGSNDISAYTIDTLTGVLTPVAGSPFPAGMTPVFVTVVTSDLGQAFAYVANQRSNDISAYAIDGTTGALTPLAGSPFSAGLSPFLVTFNSSPYGQLFAYVANQGSNDISAYAIDGTTGALTPVAGSPFAAGTTPVFVAPLPPLQMISGISHGFACVANQGSNDVSAYTIDGITGALIPAPGSPFAAGTSPFICGVLFQ